MAAHAKLSPSGAHRWSVCTAAPGEEAGKTDNGSDAARAGTADHLISELCLLDEFGFTNPEDFLGKHVVDGETVVDAITDYVNFVREIDAISENTTC